LIHPIAEGEKEMDQKMVRAKKKQKRMTSAEKMSPQKLFSSFLISD
jgi:hypothetical protein